MRATSGNAREALAGGGPGKPARKVASALDAELWCAQIASPWYWWLERDCSAKPNEGARSQSWLPRRQDCHDGYFASRGEVER